MAIRGKKNRTNNGRRGKAVTVGKRKLGLQDETSVTTTIPDEDKLAQANAVRAREQSLGKAGRKPKTFEEMLQERRKGLTESDDEIRARILRENK